MHVQSCCFVNLTYCFLPFSLTSPSSLFKLPNQCRIQTLREGGGRSSSPLDKGGGAVSKKMFSALRVSVWSKNKGGVRAPSWPSPGSASADISWLCSDDLYCSLFLCQICQDRWDFFVKASPDNAWFFSHEGNVKDSMILK